MWANEEVLVFIEGLRQFNQTISDPQQAVGFYALDLYSLYTSIEAVLQYLQDVDPQTAQEARRRYACLTPWEQDPVSYGAAAFQCTTANVKPRWLRCCKN